MIWTVWFSLDTCYNLVPRLRVESGYKAISVMVIRSSYCAWYCTIFRLITYSLFYCIPLTISLSTP